jgi:hypothetical protein
MPDGPEGGAFQLGGCCAMVAPFPSAAWFTLPARARRTKPGRETMHHRAPSWRRWWMRCFGREVAPPAVALAGAATSPLRVERQPGAQISKLVPRLATFALFAAHQLAGATPAVRPGRTWLRRVSVSSSSGRWVRPAQVHGPTSTPTIRSHTSRPSVSADQRAAAKKRCARAWCHTPPGVPRPASR